jgi:hypothetical protein
MKSIREEIIEGFSDEEARAYFLLQEQERLAEAVRTAPRLTDLLAQVARVEDEITAVNMQPHVRSVCHKIFKAEGKIGLTDTGA